MEEFGGVADGNSEVGSAEAVENSEIDADDFPLVIKERAAGSSGGGSSVVNNFVLKNVADVALRGGGANEILRGKAGDDLRDIGRAAGNFLRGFRAGAGEDTLNASGITDEDDGLTGDGGVTAIVEIEESGLGRGGAVETQRGDIGLRRDAIHLGGKSLRLAREIGSVRERVGLGAVVDQRLEFFIAPPRFGDVMVGKQATVFADQKAGAKNVELEVGAVAVEVELYHALIVQARLAEFVHSNEQRFAGRAVEEFHNHVQQADAGTIGVDDGFGDLGVAFDAAQALLGVGQLPAEFGIVTSASRHFFLKLVGLRLERGARGGLRGGVERQAGLLGAAEDVALLDEAGGEAGDFRSDLLSFFAGLLGCERRDEGRGKGDDAEHQNGGENPSTLPGDGATAEGIHGDFGEMLALFELLEFAAQRFGRGAVAELGTDAGGEFGGVEWDGDDFVGAEIESTSALQRAAADQHQDADEFGGFAGFELGDDSAAAQVGGSGFRENEFRLGGFNLGDVERVQFGGFKSLTGEAAVDILNRLRSEIEEKDAHRDILSEET